MKKEIYVPFEPHGVFGTIKIKVKSWIIEQISKHPALTFTLIVLIIYFAVGSLIYFGGIE